MSALNRHLYERIHRVNALIVSTFIVMHLTVNLSAWLGAQTHGLWQSATRSIYQNMWVEPVLILCILAQVATGFHAVVRRRRLDYVTASGLYLASFMLIHATAAISARTFSGIDTNYFWAAGSLNYGWLGFVFALYYILAVISLCTHLHAAFSRGWPHRKLRLTIGPKFGLGFALMLAIILVLPFTPIMRNEPIPQDVADYFYTYFGWTGQVPRAETS